MFVVKRNGQRENMHFDKITERIINLCSEIESNDVLKSDNLDALNIDILNPANISLEVIRALSDGMTTCQIDELAAETIESKCVLHPDFGKLSSRITVSNLHKRTPSTFSEAMRILFNDNFGILSETFYHSVSENTERLNAMIEHSRDYQFSTIGINTLMKGYLLKQDNLIVERPQYLFMRIALFLNSDEDVNMDQVEIMYNNLSKGFYTHATPTMFNAGTLKPQLASCFLLTIKDDSIDGIYDTLKDVAKISQNAGGIGVAITKIRPTGAPIRGTNGISNGLVPMLRVFNETAAYVDQGGGKRKGSFAMYLEPWHCDIEKFVCLKRETGDPKLRTRDLFLALWINNLFMKRVQENGMWSLFSSNQYPELIELTNQAFEERYIELENLGLFTKQIRAQELWAQIIECQIETGVPYMMHKDACNFKSNQKNLGTIHSSNLCCEIIEYSSPEEIAVCNLASICLSKFIKTRDFQMAQNDIDIPNGRRAIEFNNITKGIPIKNTHSNVQNEMIFDFEQLGIITREIVRNINNVIDKTYYPLPECQTSNMKHRPIGIGVQGLADAFILMRIAFDSEEAEVLNAKIFECMYYNALLESNNLAKEQGPYESFEGSPASQGILQFDLWKQYQELNSLDEAREIKFSGTFDWQFLKEQIMEHGLRNSLLLAPMPTASTAQIQGNYEGFEPITSNIFSRRVLSGEYFVVNKYLIRDLFELNMWNNDIINELRISDGSVQQISNMPQHLKDIYKTNWEISQKVILNMAADRGPFIDQSQSMNLYLKNPNLANMSSMHFYAWKLGLKTGMYYLRTQAKVTADKVTTTNEVRVAEGIVESEECDACGA
jgi:ribonucleoside-diphosphate reductase alpha chain